jgi:hypothetical protein
MRFLILFSLLTVSSLSYARFDLECDRDQTSCLTEDRHLTVGDRVGLFNDYDEVVAVGVINKMQGVRRRIKIIKSYGKIHRGVRIASLDSDLNNIRGVEERYTVFNPPKKYNFGGNLALGKLQIGEYHRGAIFSGFGQQRSSYRWFHYVGRSSLLVSQGRIGREDDTRGIDKQDMEMWGLGLHGGVAATLRESRDISFKGESTVGLMYLDAAIGGNSKLVEDSGFNSKVSNGVGTLVQFSISMQYNMNPWRLETLISQSFVHQAPMLSLGLGISKDVD